eukprot:350202-Chlamydomonas_euryale.AAC.2
MDSSASAREQPQRRLHILHRSVESSPQRHEARLERTIWQVWYFLARSPAGSPASATAGPPLERG